MCRVRLLLLLCDLIFHLRRHERGRQSVRRMRPHQRVGRTGVMRLAVTQHRRWRMLRGPRSIGMAVSVRRVVGRAPLTRRRRRRCPHRRRRRRRTLRLRLLLLRCRLLCLLLLCRLLLLLLLQLMLHLVELLLDLRCLLLLHRQ